MTCFTLCSNNYLAQAKTLGDSYKKHHPDHEFVIGLVDKISPVVDYDQFKGLEIVPVDDIGIPDFIKLQEQFNITELNTTVKPFYFSHLFKIKRASKIIYLDPDILVFSPFVELLELLDIYNIIVTPHFCSPVDDGHSPVDHTLLMGGTFNLGFIALSEHVKIASFLDWWSDRVKKYGFGRPQSHMFYDQLLINLVPAFFDNYYVLRHLGYNMAGWNLFERTITSYNEQEIIINDSMPLRFFHFSGYKFNNPEVICSYNNRYDFISRPDVKRIFNDYQQSVMGNNYTELKKIVPVYMKKENKVEVVKISIPRKISFRLKRTARVFLGFE